jgi:hypothetical protein
VSLDESLKYALNEFLRKACKIANGDTQKSINVFEIWDDTFHSAIERKHALPTILKVLRASNFIRDGNNENEIKVTLQGIYYVVDSLGEPPENIGVLSHADVKNLENLFLQSLYEQTKGDPTRTVDIVEIEKRIGGVSGITRILQIAEHLKVKGLIEIIDNYGQIKVKVPSKQVKKYYPPPSSPRGSFSSTSFSSTSFST